MNVEVEYVNDVICSNIWSMSVSQEDRVPVPAIIF